MKEWYWLWIGFALFTLNVVDTAATFYFLQHQAYEVVPWNAALIAFSPVLFALVKNLSLAVFILILFKSGSKLAKAGLVGTTVFYVMVAGYHLLLVRQAS